MKLLNNFDKEVSFENLEEAIKYYLPQSDIPCTEDEYLGNDYKTFCFLFENYKYLISTCNTLQELAEVLNCFSDTFSDGRVHEVVD